MQFAMENTECCGYLNDRLLKITDSSESACKPICKRKIIRLTDCRILLYVQKYAGTGVKKTGK